MHISISQHLAPITGTRNRKDFGIPSPFRRVGFGSRNSPEIESFKTCESRDLPDSPKLVHKPSCRSRYIRITEGSHTDRAPKILADSDLIYKILPSYNGGSTNESLYTNTQGTLDYSTIPENLVYKSQNLLNLSHLDRSLLSSGQLSSYVNTTKGIYGSQILPIAKVSPKSDIIKRKCTHDTNFKDMLSHIGTNGELFRQTIGHRPRNAWDEQSMKGPELTREEQLMTHWPSYQMSEEHPKIIGKYFWYFIGKTN